LQSDAGDTIGLGKSYSYSRADARIQVTFVAGKMSIAVDGDEHWAADFVPPAGNSALEVGIYSSLPTLPVSDPKVGAFRWYGEGRGCAQSTGTVTIRQVSYNGEYLQSFIMSFERHCDNASAALHGEVHWTVADTSTPPGIVSPAPSTLWQPSANLIPASGNYVILQSDAGERVGLGRTQVISDVDSAIYVTFDLDNQIHLTVWGDHRMDGRFHGMDQQVLSVGYLGSLRGLPFYNPVRGGMALSGDGRGCRTLAGWFTVDRLVGAQFPGKLLGLDMRFEQVCDDLPGRVLHGAIHWDAPADRSGLPTATLQSAGSWHAPQSQLPASGNYLYLQSSPGESIGQARTLALTPLNAGFQISAEPGLLKMDVQGSSQWSGRFNFPAGQNLLQTGIYDASQQAAQGFLYWSSDHRGCQPNAWVAVDGVSYAGGQLASLDLRFEQVCDKDSGTLKGQLHWRADDTRVPPGPLLPVPSQIWLPAANSLPSSGNYVVLESDRSDFVGAGITAVYTQTNAALKVVANGPDLTIQIDGDEHWTANMQPMLGQSQIAPGYYEILKEGSERDRSKGGFTFYGEGRGCNIAVSSVAIDNVLYAGSELRSLDARFEQHCEEFPGATRGAIHWTSNDNTQPPGPVFPAPATLWRPPAGATSDTGKYVYFQSESGDVLGSGKAWTLSAPSAVFSVSTLADGTVEFDLGGAFRTFGWFKVMSSRTRFEPGYYGSLMQVPGNPARGAMGWAVDGVGCNTLSGWFAVDDVAYDGAGQLTLLDVRFEQYCEEASGPLRGRMRWTR